MRWKRKTILLSLMMVLLFIGAVASVVYSQEASQTPVEPWYSEAVQFVENEGLMTCSEAEGFDPDGSMTNEALVTVLYKLDLRGQSAEAECTDLPTYSQLLTWARNNALLNLEMTNQMDAQSPVTREQFIRVLYAYAEHSGRDTSAKAEMETLENFSDTAHVNIEDVGHILWALKAELINGSDGSLMLQAQTTRAQAAVIFQKFIEKEEHNMNTLNLKIGEKTLTATLVENSSTQALRAMLEEGPITIDMRDYGNMEKVGSFGTSLPTNNQQIRTEAGDLILYQGNAFVIYYEPNAWNFTRLGKINDVTKKELKEVLGSGSVSVTLSLD